MGSMPIYRRPVTSTYSGIEHSQSGSIINLSYSPISCSVSWPKGRDEIPTAVYICRRHREIQWTECRPPPTVNRYQPTDVRKKRSLLPNLQLIVFLWCMPPWNIRCRPTFADVDFVRRVKRPRKHIGPPPAYSQLELMECALTRWAHVGYNAWLLYNAAVAAEMSGRYLYLLRKRKTRCIRLLILESKPNLSASFDSEKLCYITYIPYRLYPLKLKRRQEMKYGGKRMIRGSMPL